MLDALEELTDPELLGLIDAAYNTPQIAPGLLAWLDRACQWELDRRKGLEYELQSPETVIPDEEDAYSIDAALALRAAFATDRRHMHAFFDALARVLTGSGRKN